MRSKIQKRKKPSNKINKKNQHINKQTSQNISSSIVNDINFLLKNLKRIMITNFAKNINSMRFIKNNKSQENLRQQVKRIIYLKIVQQNKIVI